MPACLSTVSSAGSHPQPSPEISGGHDFSSHADGGEQRHDAEKDQGGGEDLSTGSRWRTWLDSNRARCEHGRIERVEQTLAFNQP
jgi:hypothetical protein